MSDWGQFLSAVRAIFRLDCIQRAKSGSVAARPCQARNEPCTNRVDDVREHDWHAASNLLQCRHIRGSVRKLTQGVGLEAITIWVGVQACKHQFWAFSSAASVPSPLLGDVDIGLVRRILHVDAAASVRPAEAMLPVRRPAAFSKNMAWPN